MQTHVNNSDLCRVAQVSGADHPTAFVCGACREQVVGGDRDLDLMG